ncbi:MAG TPA: TIGR03086 family metal-binding protein [Actinophytocola sp.]|nr:TIGR03086 family metal-binding protein [Actinophytocola sp.]
MTNPAVDLAVLERGYRTTAAVLAAMPADRWDAPTPCTEWTVREVADHLVEALDFFAATVTGARQTTLETTPVEDRAAAYRAAADRCLAAFGRPGVLTAEHPFPGRPLSGAVIANISLSESLVHGWDLTTAAGLPYAPDPDVVAAVLAYNENSGGPVIDGLFADPVPVPAGAPPLVTLLGKLGREVR